MKTILIDASSARKKAKELALTKTIETNNSSERIDEKDKERTSINNIKKNIVNKKKESLFLKQYQKYFQKKLVIKYNILPNEYRLMKIDDFITSKYCHDLASFKENLIFYYNEEFLKRYYFLKESYQKIPLFSDFYKSYLIFFCVPTLAELNLNNLIEEMVEKKAKAFYKENFKDCVDKQKKSEKAINTLFFTNKVKHEISRKNTLMSLTKTTIANNISSKSSKSLLSIGIIFNELNPKINKNANISVSQKSIAVKKITKKIYANDNIQIKIKDNNSSLNRKIPKNIILPYNNITENISKNKSNSKNKKISYTIKTNENKILNPSNYITNNNINIINKNSVNEPYNTVAKPTNKIRKLGVLNSNLKTILKFNTKLLRYTSDILDFNQGLSIKSSTKTINKKQIFKKKKIYTNNNNTIFSTNKEIKSKIKNTFSSISNNNKKKKIIKKNKIKPTTSRNNRSGIDAIKSLKKGEISNNISNAAKIVKKFTTKIAIKPKSFSKQKIKKTSNRVLNNGINETCYYKKINNIFIHHNSKLIIHKRTNYNLKSIINNKSLSSNKLLLSSYNKGLKQKNNNDYISKKKVIQYNFSNNKVNNTIDSDSQKIFRKLNGIIINKKK